MRLLPVLLVHDLGGRPDDWDAWGVESYLVNEGGLDPRLIRRFDFGYKREGRVPRYDAQGSIIEIAHRLSDDPAVPDGEVFQVDSLAAESQALGGPDKVSIVAVGAGGIAVRYYLSRGEPDRWGTRYGGRVDKVILVGVPNRGASFYSFAKDTLRSQRVWRWLGRLRRLRIAGADAEAALRVLHEGLDALHQRVLDEMVGNAGQPVSAKSLGTLQCTPTSFLLRWLNRRDRVPQGVRFYCLAGEITLLVRMPLLGGARPWLRLNLGDLLVSRRSATAIPGARPQVLLFRQTFTVDLTEAQVPTDPLRWVGGDLPYAAHTRLMRSPQVQRAVLDILCRE